MCKDFFIVKNGIVIYNYVNKRGVFMFFIKKYYPAFVSTIFLFIYGFLFGAIFSQNSYILESDSPLMYALLIVVILLVIVIWAEIIGFIVHAAKNKKLKKNNVLWCILIYFLNVFIIPYYNLKHVWNEKKVKVPMIIIGTLFAVSFVLGVFIPFMINGDGKNTRKTYVVDDDREVEFVFYGNYIEREVGAYDLYASDYHRGINVGAFVYDDDEDDANVIQKSQVNWLKSNRLNTSTVETFKIELDDRSVDCEAIYGEIDGDSYIYLISTIDFKYDDNIVNVFQVTYEDDYDDYKEEFKQILIDAKTLD